MGANAEHRPVDWVQSVVGVGAQVDSETDGSKASLQMFAVSSGLAPQRNNSAHLVTCPPFHALVLVVVAVVVKPRVAKRVQQKPLSGEAGNCTLRLLIFSPEVELELDLDCTPPSQPVLRTPVRTCCCVSTQSQPSLTANADCWWVAKTMAQGAKMKIAKPTSSCFPRVLVGWLLRLRAPKLQPGSLAAWLMTTPEIQSCQVANPKTLIGLSLHNAGPGIESGLE